MSKEKEYLKKIIKYRISYSGTKETDIIYKKIISEKIRYLSLDELKLLSNIFKELSDVDISASTKTKIIDRVNAPINRLVKFKFEKMFLEDKLYTALPNLTSWLMTNFNQLNRYAEKSHNQ